MLSQDVDDAGGGGHASGHGDSRFSHSQVEFHHQQHHQQYDYDYDDHHQQQQHHHHHQQLQHAPRSMWQQPSYTGASSAWADVIGASSSSSLRGGPTTLDAMTTATTENAVTGTGKSTTAAAGGSSSTATKKSAKKAAAAKKDVFICSEVHCGKQFPRSFALRRHQRIHTGNKPYACDELGCTQRFNTSGNLSRHKRIHSGERPYPCIFASCGKKFNTSTKLKRHMRIHFPEGQNLFRCIGVNCSWSCDNYKEFAQHQKVHHGIIVGAGLQTHQQSQYQHPAAAGAGAGAPLPGLQQENDPSLRNSALKSDADFFLQPPDQHHQHHQHHQQHHGRPDFDILTPSHHHHHHAQQQQQLHPPASSSSNSFLFNSFIVDKGKQATPPPPVGPRKIMAPFFSGAGSDLSLPLLPKEQKKGLLGDTDHGYADVRRGKSAIADHSAFPQSDHDATQYHHSRSSSYETSSFALGSESSYPRGSSAFGTHFSHLRSGSSSDGTEDYDHHSQQPLQHQHQHQHHSGSGGQHHHVPAHHVLRPPQSDEAMKFGGYAGAPPMNPAAPEFTGEELSVVLELMKDPYC